MFLLCLPVCTITLWIKFWVALDEIFKMRVDDSVLIVIPMTV